MNENEDPQDMNVEVPDAEPENMTYIQFYLPREMKEKLRRIADQRGITMSEAARRGLKPYLSKVK